MIHKVSGLSAAVVASALCAALPAQAAEYRTTAQPIEGQYIVVLKNSSASLANEPTRTARVATVAAQIASIYNASLLRSYDHVLRGFAVKASDAAMLRMLQDPRIAYIEEDGIAHASATTTQTGVTWGLDRIDQRDPTPQTNPPTPLTYTYATPASNVHAYIIDSGVLGTHEEFTKPTNRMGAGYTAINDSYGTNGCNVHGTHVAGILGGKTYGVAKGVTIHPVRVLDCNGDGAWSQIIDGIDWTASHHISPAVANISIGGPANSSVDTAVANLVSSGVTVAIAAGNGYGNACQVSPADVASAITVGATRNDDLRADFSNSGSCVDIFAPGVGILSASNYSPTAVATLSGTSMASPYVAGIAALLVGAHPAWTPAQVWNHVKANATPSRVLGAGTGSPNLLAYSLVDTTTALLPVAAPTVSLACDGADGGNHYSCNVSYTTPAGSTAAIQWPGTTTLEGDTFNGNCVDYIPPQDSTLWVTLTVAVTVSNRSGSTTKSDTFRCFAGGDPR